jgi:hypothetical protein
LRHDRLPSSGNALAERDHSGSMLLPWSPADSAAPTCTCTPAPQTA